MTRRWPYYALLAATAALTLLFLATPTEHEPTGGIGPAGTTKPIIITIGSDGIRVAP